MRHDLILVRDDPACSIELADKLITAGHHVSFCLVDFGDNPAVGYEKILGGLSDRGAVIYYFTGNKDLTNSPPRVKGLLIRPLYELGRLVAECDTMMVL
ncbi:MAG: hypothetical protein J7M18_05675 [Candidatus Eremiobacteraeota bacterium]|nr:hypothetical protein [Candidatus Eremiobacteraeota bacterium]